MQGFLFYGAKYIQIIKKSKLKLQIYSLPDSIWIEKDINKTIFKGFDPTLKIKWKSLTNKGIYEYRTSESSVNHMKNMSEDEIIKKAENRVSINYFGSYNKAINAVFNEPSFINEYFEIRDNSGNSNPSIFINRLLNSNSDFNDYFIKRITVIELVYWWVTRSIKKYGDYLWPNIDIKTWEYFNSGFIVVSKKHKQFFDKVHKYYEDNVDKIKYAQDNFQVGNDQTPLNFLVRHFDVDLKLLPNCYNLQDIFRKNLLHFPGHSWFSDELHFLKTGWIYHFNAVPQHERHSEYWLKRTYNHLYGDL